MPFKKGKSGNPAGTRKQKLAFEALSMEIAEDPRRMRRIAQALLTKAEDGDMQAIKEVFDRLDGKPAQTVAMNVDDKRTASDWSRNELVAFLADAGNRSGGASEEDGRDGASDSVH